MTAHEGTSVFFPGNLNVSRDEVKIRGKQNRCFTREQLLYVLLYSIDKINHDYQTFPLSNLTLDNSIHRLVNNFRDVGQPGNI